MIKCLCVLVAVVAVASACQAGKQTIRSGGLSQQEMQAIVDEHNQLRQSVALGQVSSQPPAANMMEMKWDDELAARAQSWADNCITAHDRATQRDVGRFPVGQNIAATWTTRRPSGPYDETPDFSKQINAWFDEVRAYGYKPAGSSHGTGHYSQLVWGESSHVGCGFTFYYDPSRGYTKLYVCNYGPGGNVIGYRPYEKGMPACSTYGLSDSQKYSGLCADSYGNAINSYEQPNVIPESAPDAAPQYDPYAYKSALYPWQQKQQEQKLQEQQPEEPIRTSTYKPFVSLFGSAEKIIASALHQNRRGFRFGTLYFK